MSLKGQPATHHSEWRPRAGQNHPGVITDEFDDGRGNQWVTIEFVVSQNYPLSDVDRYCDQCRNNEGWWMCSDLGRNCWRCQCGAEHTWVQCPGEHGAFA